MSLSSIATACSIGSSISDAWLASNFCVEEIPVVVDMARTVITLGRSDLWVLERGSSSVIWIQDSDGDDLPDTRTTLVTAAGLNHGLCYHNGYMYASTESHVFRWSVSRNFEVVGSMETVIDNMSTGGHATRTIIFDSQGRLYVTIGSYKNVDSDSSRARIRRFVIHDVTFPIDFQSGEVFADGLRNEVGLAFDKFGVLWGVENSADRLIRRDLGSGIELDNPAEELNRFHEEDAGKHWGYPWCWTEFSIPEPYGKGPGTAWAWPTTMTTISDSDCQSNFVPPALALQGYSAPLGIAFYNYTSVEHLPTNCIGTFPKSMDGFAFLAYHGSWNRDDPTGFKVVYVEMDTSGNVRSGTAAKDLLMHQPPYAQWNDGFRPVDVAFDVCGRLIVTSDGTGGSGSKLVRISYVESSAPHDNTDNPATTTNSPVTSPITDDNSYLTEDPTISPVLDPTSIPSTRPVENVAPAYTEQPTVSQADGGSTDFDSNLKSTNAPSAYPFSSPNNLLPITPVIIPLGNPSSLAAIPPNTLSTEKLSFRPTVPDSLKASSDSSSAVSNASRNSNIIPLSWLLLTTSVILAFWG